MGFGDTSAKDKSKAKAASADEAARKAQDDKDWEENDKGNSKKAARAAAKDDKADAKASSKKELKELEAAEEAEMSKLKGANKAATSKVTQAEILRRQALMAAAKAAPKKTDKTTTVDAPSIEENTNRQENLVEASGIDAALSALDTGDKKSKMTYKEYEDMVLEDIRKENPGLKMQQAKERAWKQWERSPENPKNQGEK